MIDPRTDPTEPQLDLFSLFVILVKRWWVVVIVFLAAIAVALASWSVQDDPLPEYEARTSLLIVTPVSYRVPNQESTQEVRADTPRLSVDTILSLATAKDLYQNIIDDLDLTDADGAPISVDGLAKLMHSSVSTPDEDSNVPLLTTTVQGNDPVTVGLIARKWADAFTEKNAEVVALVLDESYAITVNAFETGASNLEAKHLELLDYQETRITDRLNVLEERLTSRNQIKSERANERLSVSVSIALKSQNREIGITQSAHLRAIDQLESKMIALVGAKSRLNSSLDALSKQDPVILLERRISNDSLFAFLTTQPTPEGIAGLEDLVLVEEQKNEIYYRLSQQVIEDESNVASLESEILNLMDVVSSLDNEISTLSLAIDSGNGILAQFDDITDLLLENFEEESRSIDDQMTLRTALGISQSTQEIEILTENQVLLANAKADADVPREDGSETIRLVETAITPSTPINAPDSRPLSQLLLIAVAVGLFLGTLTAFGYHAFLLALARVNVDLHRRSA